MKNRITTFLNQAGVEWRHVGHEHGTFCEGCDPPDASAATRQIACWYRRMAKKQTCLLIYVVLVLVGCCGVRKRVTFGFTTLFSNVPLHRYFYVVIYLRLAYSWSRVFG